MKIDLNRFPGEVGCIRDLCLRFHLKLDTSDANRALMIGENFAVSVIVDREGVRYWYIDTSNPPEIIEYALDYFIIRKRYPADSRVSPASKDNVERVRTEFRDACEQLKVGGSDILSGNRDWIKEYNFGITRPVGDYRKNLLSIISKK